MIKPPASLPGALAQNRQFNQYVTQSIAKQLNSPSTLIASILTIIKMHAPWRDWYHCNGNTYGTWLPGDPRGFRTRLHKTHIKGDYRSPPPPGRDAAILERSRHSMKDTAVSLDRSQRGIACREMAAKMLALHIELIALAVDDHHYHILARFPDHRPRLWVGRAKYHSSMVLRGAKSHARIWASGCRALPIRDRAHQRNAFNYIIRHRMRGAAVWTFRDPIPTCTRTPHAKRNEP